MKHIRFNHKFALHVVSALTILSFHLSTFTFQLAAYKATGPEVPW